MLSFEKGLLIAIINGEKLNGEIIHINTEDEKCCKKCTDKC